MRRTVTVALTTAVLAIGCTGCMSRMVHESVGAATGASGKVVAAQAAPDLTSYKSLRVETIGVAPGLQVPAEMPSLLATDLLNAAKMRNLAPEGEPALNATGQIIHYETSGTVDTAIGPLAETVVAMKLIDAQTGKVVAQANLIGRSKATASSSPKSLAGGVAKAMDTWLKEGGLRKVSEKEKE